MARNGPAPANTVMQAALRERVRRVRATRAGKGQQTMVQTAVPEARKAVISPSVEIHLGGRARHLRFDLNAMALIDDQLGVNMLMGGLAREIRPANLRVYLWAGLNAGDEDACEPELHDPETGIRLVASWVTFRNVPEVMMAVTRAIQDAQPEPEDEGEAEAEPTGEGEEADAKNPPDDSSPG